MENKGVCMNIAFDLLYNVFHTYDQVDIHTNHNNPIIGQAPHDKAPSRTHFQQASAIRHRPTPFRMCDHQHCFVCLINHKLVTHTHTPTLIFGHCAPHQFILDELGIGVFDMANPLNNLVL